ncbi:MAG: hypothetical protein QM784_27790 [Polyangiaceae bacterium]
MDNGPSSFLSSLFGSKSKAPTLIVEEDLWPENGGYLVLGPAGNPAIDTPLFAQLYPSMIGCTFPITGEPTLASTLCPDYDPRRRGQHILVKRFGGMGCRFLFVPRTLFCLLYHVFVSVIEPETVSNSIRPTKISPKQLQLQDASMYLAYKNTDNVLTYFSDVVNEQKTFCPHYAHFNAWALAFLSERGHHILQTLHLVPDQITYFTPELACQAALPLVQMLRHKKTEAVTLAVTNLIKAELQAPQCTFLTRFNESTGICIAERKGGTGAYTGHSFSNSFGADLFAAAFGEGADHHANTLGSVGNHLIFAVPINIADYRNRRGVAACFWIPPYPSPCQAFCGMNELWHPRSRVLLLAKKRPEDQYAFGISNYSLGSLSRNSSIITADVIPWMWYHTRLSLKEMIQLSEQVEKYIGTQAITLAKPSQK